MWIWLLSVEYVYYVKVCIFDVQCLVGVVFVVEQFVVEFVGDYYYVCFGIVVGCILVVFVQEWCFEYCEEICCGVVCFIDEWIEF